ncbi:MAG TPA: abscisic acid-deficient protein Aba4 family protein [Myxococcota bacterium]|nr:abscisic acid-deficient protein Aba4 family protein [Myxococcota bacterium]
MSAAQVFQLLNLLVLPWWAVFLAAPRSRIAGRAASHAAIFVGLSLLYAALLAGAVDARGGEGGFDFDGLRAVLGTPRGFLAGWTHYLAFDLFIGAWIVRESGRLGVEPRPYLFLTLVAGPIGLGGFLIRRWLRLRTLGQLGEPDLI